MTYKHLSDTDRHYIEVRLKKGDKKKDIAQSLGRAASTITRELKRNTGKRGYRHKQAQGMSEQRHKEKPKAIKVTAEVETYIRDGLHKDWSPEQICGRLHLEQKIKLHHETVYRYILNDKACGGELYNQLRHKAKPYRKRYGSSTNSRMGIPNRVDIAERPKAANDRKRVGDFEADTIIGKGHKGAIVTLDERVTKLRLAAPVKRKEAHAVSEAIVELLTPFSLMTKSITYDNGKEFAKHTCINDKLDCESYFAKPYHSWERGQNENANGLLRQYFPKTERLDTVQKSEVSMAVHRLNSRPRKCLGYKTPYEAFEKRTGINAEQIMVLHL